ncbi:integral membrane sensor signal transduction histidine kinase [Caldithrix abyssi DSM 13497]|uniref:histidine kinase n=2 Tax=Caldithrix abyssi TaxID=187145 RepID=H1XY15_CALAY|nr:HAMP domain-containing sensor histidine kinase [Caldithrix abyssi]APF20605.1 Signal transduction histidine kinase [Caldithrix abyssi DSM 13497]EHO40890.1 integral membrane sensor signal transduction histidine kinase [Caldithrix abyssi DSM 13497]
MQRLKFRYRIIITITGIVLFVSFIGFHFFYSYFLAKIKDNYIDDMKMMLSLLQENYLYNLKSDGGKVLYSLMDNLVKTNKVDNVYLLDKDGVLVYPLPTKGENKSQINLELSKLINTDSKTETKIYELDRDVYRGLMLLQNNPSCYSCHDPSEKQLGYIVIDLDLASIHKNSEMFILFGRVFAILLILFILSSMRILHYRTIKYNLNRFKDTIARISKGDFSERVKIEDVEELGDLAQHFNFMIEKIHEMQVELSVCNQNKLKNAQKLASIGEMAASLAHEIKNPLMGITNAIEVIAREISDPEHKIILREIRYQAGRVNKAINDLLQYAKPIDLELEVENLNDLIKHNIYFYQKQFKENQIEFKLKLDYNLPLLKIDRKLMENVLTNLIQNAIQAIPQERPGRILIETKYIPVESIVQIIVEDNGIGISKEDYQKIFKPFYSTKQSGTGLGLAIIQRIIEQLDGRIEVESKVGHYTRFIITLPSRIIRIKKNEFRQRVLHGSY